MKKLFPLAVITAIALFALTTSCKKSDDSPSAGGHITAKVNGTSWSSTVDSVYNMGGVVYIYGVQVSGSTASAVSILFPTAPAVGTYDMDMWSSTKPHGVYSSGSGTGSQSAHGTVTITSVSPNYVGTFSFTGTDSTKITDGTFNIVKK